MMRKTVILLVLGMVLVGMTASAISEDKAMEEHGDDRNDGEQGKEPASGGSPYDGYGPASNSDEGDEESA